MTLTLRVGGTQDVEPLAERITLARRLLVLTGAGISAASGLPTYHGPGGLYENVEMEGLHHAAGLPGNLPSLWAFWGPLRQAVLDSEPNPAHFALAEYQRRAQRTGRSFTLATQNVDDLHERAGSHSVAHLHGSLFSTRCSSEGCSYALAYDAAAYERPPECPVCGSALRPGIVLFGESPDVDAQWRASRAVSECDVLLVVGTSGQVSTSARFVRYAADAGAFVVTVDPARRVAHRSSVHVGMPAEIAVPRLLGVTLD